MPRSKVYRPVQQAYRKHTKIYRPRYATPTLPPPRRPTPAANTREEFEPSPKKSLATPPPPG